MTGYILIPRKEEAVSVIEDRRYDQPVRYSQENFDRLLSLSFRLEKELHIARLGDKRILRRTIDVLNKRLGAYKESFPEEYSNRLRDYALRVGKVG